jgi:hypothetical protein
MLGAIFGAFPTNVFLSPVSALAVLAREHWWRKAAGPEPSPAVGARAMMVGSSLLALVGYYAPEAPCLIGIATAALYSPTAAKGKAIRATWPLSLAAAVAPPALMFLSLDGAAVKIFYSRSADSWQTVTAGMLGEMRLLVGVPLLTAMVLFLVLRRADDASAGRRQLLGACIICTAMLATPLLLDALRARYLS